MTTGWYSQGVLARKKQQNEDTMMLGAKRVRMVRGGSICDPNDRSPSIIRGSLQTAMCVPTSVLHQKPGTDPDFRPRYRPIGSVD